MKLKYLDAPLTSAGTLADRRQVLVTISTADVDRAGDIVEQSGIDFSNFVRTGSPILYNHDTNFPIAKAIDIGIVGGKLRSLAQFPPVGASQKSDEVLRLIQAGVISSASIGFRTIEAEPVDRRDPYGGTRFKRAELCEWSFVAVPANASATVIAKALKSGRVMSRENVDLLTKLAKSLGKSEGAHADALDALEEADRHRRKAMQHASRLAANAGAGGDVDPDDDPDADVELSAARKRAIAIAELAGGDYLVEDKESARRRRQIAIFELALLS
jgi:HK97 family phage prohead protease